MAINDPFTSGFTTEKGVTKADIPKAERPNVSVPKKVPHYRLASGESAIVPGLGFKLTNEMLKKDFVIRAIEDFEARSGKHVMGRVVVLD